MTLLMESTPSQILSHLTETYIGMPGLFLLPGHTQHASQTSLPCHYHTLILTIRCWSPCILLSQHRMCYTQQFHGWFPQIAYSTVFLSDRSSLDTPVKLQLLNIVPSFISFLVFTTIEYFIFYLSFLLSVSSTSI